jgi:heme/copper-type cytochrome/quinol oxidase subunit 2
MIGAIAQVQDSTLTSSRIEEGHQLLTEHINLLTTLVIAVVVIGSALLIRYALFERRRNKTKKADE